MFEIKPFLQPSICKPSLDWGQIMEASLYRRVSIASCWASSRIAVLDSKEEYEDSYAITQEFREWITCLDDYSDHLEASVLQSPSSKKLKSYEKSADPDEFIEI